MLLRSATTGADARVSSDREAHLRSSSAPSTFSYTEEERRALGAFGKKLFQAMGEESYEDGHDHDYDYDYDYDYGDEEFAYDEYDDFPLQFSSGGGASSRQTKTKNKKKKGGRVYSSKHVRRQAAAAAAASAKKPPVQIEKRKSRKNKNKTKKKIKH